MDYYNIHCKIEKTISYFRKSDCFACKINSRDFNEHTCNIHENSFYLNKAVVFLYLTEEITKIEYFFLSLFIKDGSTYDLFV